MSRHRILAKLRPQQWFSDLTAYVEAEGHTWGVTVRQGSHPKLVVTCRDGRVVEHVIPCTPRTTVPTTMYIASLRRALHRTNEPRPAIRSAWTPERIACLTRGVNPLAGDRLIFTPPKGQTP